MSDAFHFGTHGVSVQVEFTDRARRPTVKKKTRDGKRPIGSVVIVALLTAISAAGAPVSAQDLASPFDAADLGSGERWLTRDHGGGAQTLGHDFTIRRYTGSNTWTCNKAGTDGSENRHKLSWNKPFYAIEDGTIERCWRNNPDNERPGVKDERIGPGPNGISSGGNHLLVRRPNGDLLLYAHARKGTIPLSLCPVTQELLGAGQDKGHIFPQGDQPSIERGQFLGRVGNSGNSTGPHLHLHGVTRFRGSAVALPMQRGMISTYSSAGSNDCSGEANINSWSKLNGSPIPQKRVLYWPPRKPVREFARHKFGSSAMPRMFQHLADSGYELAWIDGYSVNGTVFYNHVWNPVQKNWRAFFGLTQSQFQTRLSEQSAAGYEPVHLDSHTRGNQVQYSIIFHKNAPGTWRLRSNLNKNQHQTFFNEAKTDGMSPTSTSVASVNGERRFSSLYRSGDIGTWLAKSRIKERDYQQVFNTNMSAGRLPIYLNAYKHGGEVFISAIFASRPSGRIRAKHAMSSPQYQSEYTKNRGDGFTTSVVTAVDGAASIHRYLGVWRK